MGCVEKMKWELIGSSDVDSGQIAIVDPCYVLTDKKYDEFLKHAYGDDNKDKNFATIKKGFAQGMVVHSGQGDGSYNVYVKRSKHNIITEAKIVFINSRDVPSMDKMMDGWVEEEKIKQKERDDFLNKIYKEYNIKA